MALIFAHLNAGHSGGDSVAIGLMVSVEALRFLWKPYGFCGSLMVSVEVKHHVYLLTSPSSVQSPYIERPGVVRMGKEGTMATAV